MTQNRAFLRFYAVIAFFTLLAGDAWRYSITWWGFSAIAVGISVVSVLLLVRHRSRWSFGTLPLALLAFVVLAGLSVIWSQYPAGTALGFVSTVVTIISGVALAVTFTREELLRALGTALRIILAGSLVFELFVSLVLRAPLLPFWVDYSSYGDDLPKLLFWSRDLILEGGKIQGLVGNSSLLGFVSLLGLIVFALQFAAKTVNRWSGAVWIALSLALIWMTRSATITIALVVLIAVVTAVLLLRLSRTRGQRLGVYGLMALVVVSIPVIIFSFGGRILDLLGKSDTLTGRAGIWEAVIGLAQQHPVLGWGWVSYWIPWIEPFDDLVVRGGVVQLHAHNAWLDMWMQLGIVGLVVFGALVLGTLLRSWSLAVDRQHLGVDRPARWDTVSLLPLLVMVALLVQSLAESRLLVEYGLALLVICAVSTKLPERRSVMA
jgi:exopolysaccharide production protein ExoQ